jgi:transposase InsO family protein
MKDELNGPGVEGRSEGPPEDDGIEFELLSKLPLTPPARPHRAMFKADQAGPAPPVTAQDKMMVLFLWARSRLPATQFAPLVGKSDHTIRGWRRRFLEHGPAGLEEKKRGAPKGSRLPEHTRQAILLMKEECPEWGVERIHDMLLRSRGFMASATAIARLLKAEGYVRQPLPTKRHPDRPRRFERAKPNQLWQTDIFTFMLKRERQRLYLIAFLDDRSRFLTGHGLYSSCSGPLVKEVFLKAVANFGTPEEVLTDQGPQYYSRRGKSAFTKLLESRGVRQIVSRSHHPQTLGKIERFWGTLWRECLETAIFRGLDDARERIAHFADFYNFQRTHQGIEGLVPADRFFEAAPEVREALAKRVAENAAAIAKNGAPPRPFYLTGKVGDRPVSLHAEGERMILTRGDGSRQEVALTPPAAEEVPPVGADPAEEPEGSPGGEEE